MTMHAIGLTTLTNTAKDFRNDMSVGMFGATVARPTGARSGVRYGTPVTTVSLVAFAGTIKPHSGIMDVQTSATAGPYWYSVTVNETFTVAPAHATLPRVDIVTIRINDNVEDASGLQSATSHYKAGVANAAPVAPTPDTTREMIIATISVPLLGGGSPVASWVAPTAVAAGGIIPVRNDTERDALSTAYGATQTIYADHATAGLIRWAAGGTAWTVVGVADVGKYVSLTSAKPIANNAATTVGLVTPTDYAYTEVADAGSWHDAATNPDRIVPTIPGRYRVQLIGAWAANATGLRYYWIGINGSYSSKNRKVISTTDLGADPNGASVVLAEFTMNGSTNYITVQSYQTSGAALAMDLSVTVTYLGA